LGQEPGKGRTCSPRTTMRYLGMDVHVKSTVWCLLDAAGEVVEKGKSPTTAAELTGLVQRLAKNEPLVAAQECGKLSDFVLAQEDRQARRLLVGQNCAVRNDAAPGVIPTGIVRHSVAGG
jgi:hypothetical protein